MGTGKPLSKIQIDWDWQDYRIHIVIMAVVTIVMQVSLAVVQGVYPWMFNQFLILTLSTNMLALVYAIYGYSVFDDARRTAKKKMQAEGVEVMEFDQALTYIANFARTWQKIYKNNQNLFQSVFGKLETLDFNEVTKFVDSVTQVSRLLGEMGWNTKTLEEIKPSLIQIAAVGPKYAELLPEIAKLLAVTDTEKLKNSLVTMRVMMETNGVSYPAKPPEAK